MSKREHDAATKRNAGGRIASDERWQYRTSRSQEGRACGAYGSTEQPIDRLARRASYAARERRSNPAWAVLGIGSMFRAGACWRLLGRFPTLPCDQRRA